MELIKMISASEIFTQAIIFLILLALLRVFLWRPVLKALDERKQKITSDIKDAEDAKKEADTLKAQYQERLSNVGKEAALLISQAGREANQIKLAAEKAGHQEAERIIVEARENIKYEFSKAKEQLKERIVDISIMAAENVIQEKLTEEGDRKIIKDFMNKVEI